ncbi:MAG: selenium binding protein [Clostridia bacterium]
MYENYTRQSLPTKHYRELIGSAICVFNSNNSFVIENILKCDSHDTDWYHLIDLQSGHLKKRYRDLIISKLGEDIEILFGELIDMRNRIVHSFQITDHGEQILATKELIKNGNHQFKITEDYLLKFIRLNQELCDKLHDLRGY